VIHTGIQVLEIASHEVQFDLVGAPVQAAARK
jgi:hypothetical protein